MWLAFCCSPGSSAAQHRWIGASVARAADKSDQPNASTESALLKVYCDVWETLKLRGRGELTDLGEAPQFQQLLFDEASAAHAYPNDRCHATRAAALSWRVPAQPRHVTSASSVWMIATTPTTSIQSSITGSTSNKQQLTATVSTTQRRQQHAQAQETTAAARPQAAIA